MFRNILFKNIHLEENFEQRKDLQRIIQCGNLTFLVLVMLGSLSVLLSRFSVDVFPIEDLFQRFTSFPPEKINDELTRILTEGADIAFFLSMLLCISILIFGFCRSIRINNETSNYQIDHGRYTSSRAILIVSITMVGLNFAVLHPWRIEAFGQRFLDGFSMGPVVISIGVAIALNNMSKNFSTIVLFKPSTKIRRILVLFGSLILVPQLLIFGRQINLNREYLIVFNEYAAPSAGLAPFDNFATTYSSLSGILIKPFVSLVNPDDVIYTLMFFHMGLTALLIVALVVLSRRIMGMGFGIAIFTLAVLISPRQQNALAQGFLPSVSAPSRYLLPVILLFWASDFFSKTKPVLWKSLILGVIWGITLTNNAELGIPITIALFVALFAKSILDKKPFVNLILPPTALMLTFAFLLHLVGKRNTMNAFNYWSLFVMGRAQGGYISEVPIFGVHHFALALHGTTLLIGLLYITINRRTQDRERIGTSSLICIVFGVFGIVTFPYYLGQNGPSFVGGFLWLPLVLTSIALFGFLRNIYAADSLQQFEGQNRLKVSFLSPINMGLVTLFVCSVIFIPNLQDSVGIHFKNEIPSWTPRSFEIDPVVKELRIVISPEVDKSEIAYYGEYGNLIAVIYGIDSVYGTHDPMIAYSSKKTLNATCKPLKTRKPKFVYASKRYLPIEFLDARENRGPCPGLTKDMEYSSEYLIRYFYFS